MAEIVDLPVRQRF